MKKHFYLKMLVALVLCGSLSYGYAANDKPIEMTANSITYDASTGIMVAEGNVVIVKDNGNITGPRVEYNTKSKEAVITGGARAKKDTATLTASIIRSYEDNHIVAQGDAVLTKDDKRLTGPIVDYYSDKGYAVIPSNAHMTTADGVITANKLEAFMNEDRVVGEGAVHIVSDTRKLDAVADHAVYYGAKSGSGKSKAVLTGNARAVQDGNVLTGNELIIYPDEKGLTAQGRTKLIIIPKD